MESTNAEINTALSDQNPALAVKMLVSLNVPLKASFGGWKFLPWIAWGSNSMKPKLTLHPDVIEFRLFRLREKPYSSVSMVDYRSSWRTENIVIEFNDSKSTFIGNTGDRELVRNALIYMRDKGCPLSKRAAALVTAQEVAA